MKRSAPLQRRPLPRRTRLRSAPRFRDPQTVTDAERAWKVPRWGRCDNCGVIDFVPLQGHHVLARQVVARAGGDEWDERNRMDLCETCHMEHEFGQANRKISIEKVPEAAAAFAVELLGEEVAADYFRRRYGP